MSRSVKERMLDAEDRGNRLLADGNEALEQGKADKAERLYARGQYWLDLYNRLARND